MEEEEKQQQQQQEEEGDAVACAISVADEDDETTGDEAIDGIAGGETDTVESDANEHNGFGAVQGAIGAVFGFNSNNDKQQQQQHFAMPLSSKRVWGRMKRKRPGTCRLRSRTRARITFGWAYCRRCPCRCPTVCIQGHLGLPSRFETNGKGSASCRRVYLGFIAANP